MADQIVDTSANADATHNDAAAADTNKVVDTPIDAKDKPIDTALNVDDENKEVKPAWPDDWRDKFAKGDEKALKQFARYASPEALADALLAAQKRISQGELGPKKPGKDSTAEEIAAYRATLGVPDKPEAYFDKLPNGLVIGEEDKPLFDKFGALMHEENIPSSAMHKVVDWYYKEVVEEGEQQRYEINETAKRETEDALRQEYGPEYRAQIAGITNLLNTLPDGAGEILANAIGPDGVSLFNKPEVVRAMVHLVNEINPTASVIPGGSNISSIDDELDKIAKLQSTNPKEYFSEAVQQRELKLLEAKQKLQSRA